MQLLTPLKNIIYFATISDSIVFNCYKIVLFLHLLPLKVNLHSIRFSSVFLRFCFSVKKYALFHPQFHKSITALSRLLHIDKNFVQNFGLLTTRAIFQNRVVPL